MTTSSLTVEEISKLAYMKKELQNDADRADRMLYDALTILYRANGTGAISTEKCKEMKLDAVRDYDFLKGRMKMLEELVDYQAQLWLRIEPYSTELARLTEEFRNSPTVEGARLALSVAEEFRKSVYNLACDGRKGGSESDNEPTD